MLTKPAFQPVDVIVLRPRLSLRAIPGAILIVTGLMVAVVTSTRLAFVPCLIGLLIFVLGPRGFPSVVINERGVTVTSFFWTQQAAWSSITKFAVAPRFDGRFVERAAVAGIIGPAVSSNLAQKSEFMIRDRFRLPVTDVVEKLNDVRPGELTCPDYTPPEPLADHIPKWLK